MTRRLAPSTTLDASSARTDRCTTDFWVADGAVIPTALLVNPFLTISALAERTADHIHDSLDGNLEAPKVVPLVPAVRHPPPGLEFTEKMRGFITNKVTDAKSPEQFAAAAKIAKKDKDRAGVSPDDRH